MPNLKRGGPKRQYINYIKGKKLTTNNSFTDCAKI